MTRSSRHAARKAAARPGKMARTQMRKLRNAARSCGEAFAAELREFYYNRDRF